MSRGKMNRHRIAGAAIKGITHQAIFIYVEALYDQCELARARGTREAVCYNMSVHRARFWMAPKKFGANH